MGGMGTRVKSRLKPRRRHFIKEWRKFRGLTQEQLAERVGVAISSISQLETMKQGYSQPTLEAIADALNCEPADLLMRNPGAPNDPNNPGGGGPNIWSIWENLDQPAKNQAIQILETFRKTGTAN